MFTSKEQNDLPKTQKRQYPNITSITDQSSHKVKTPGPHSVKIPGSTAWVPYRHLTHLQPIMLPELEELEIKIANPNETNAFLEKFSET